MSGLKTEWAYS